MNVTPATADSTRPPAIGLSALLFTVAAVLATLGALSGWVPLTVMAALALSVFVVLEFARIRRAQQIAATVLVGIAIVVALVWGSVPEVLFNGVVRTLPFLLVFAAIGWLRAAALESPSVIALRDALGRMGSGRRFAAFTLSAHGMGAAFNLAGIGLLVPMLDGARYEPREDMRLRCGIMWGFAAATCWSPFYVGTAAVLSSLPVLRWSQVVPYGLMIAVGFLIYALAYDRFVRRRGVIEPPRDTAPLGLLRPVGRLIVAIAVLFTMTLGLVEGLHLGLTTAIALSAPTYALGWLLLIYRGTGGGRMRRIATGVVGGYASMRTETTLFVSANIFGAAISAALPAGGGFANSLPGLSGVFFVDATLMIWGYLTICALGIHPIVLLVVFTSAVDPTRLNVPLPLLGAVMMALWGMGTSVSPLSGTTLFMSQMSRASSFEIAWRWNGWFYVLGALWLAAVLTLAS
ncbi:hypothetical protein [Puniceibacterium sediminis]|uniref:Tripartite ATP-independent transporter, DctM component n=1 Tax=Puniceibacterium sediminis TaxID=1608407 RepID=A0A238X7N0_9RHOB|nr:hypothetical protein [Puniceibacterium sediminis]SNR54344.1 hypothetical protein SAMN06265370_109107 [Puniceibacterium sediminis]